LDWAAILGGGEKPTKNYGWKFVDKDGKAAALPPGVNTGPHGSDNGLFNIFGTWKPDKEEIEKGWMAFLEITQGSATPVRTPLTVTFEQPPK
jgi:hypothetical protein